MFPTTFPTQENIILSSDFPRASSDFLGPLGTLRKSTSWQISLEWPPCTASSPVRRGTASHSAPGCRASSVRDGGTGSALRHRHQFRSCQELGSNEHFWDSGSDNVDVTPLEQFIAAKTLDDTSLP